MNADDLETLYKLKEKGIITEEDFQRKKQEFLDGDRIRLPKSLPSVHLNFPKIRLSCPSVLKKICKFYFVNLQNMFNVNGRSNRKSYWSFAFINFFVLIITSFLICYIFGDVPHIIGFIILTVHLIMMTGITVRRLHDVDRRGFWYIGYLLDIPFSLFVHTDMYNFLISSPASIIFLVLSIFVGLSQFVVFCCQFVKGDPEKNRFGEPE